MGNEDATVHLEGEVPREQFEKMADKFPASAEGGKRSLFRSVVDDWERLRDQEEARLTGEMPDDGDET